jgi:hypothetical protein
MAFRSWWTASLRTHGLTRDSPTVARNLFITFVPCWMGRIAHGSYDDDVAAMKVAAGDSGLQ